MGQKKRKQTDNVQPMATQANSLSLMGKVWLPAFASCVVLLAAFPPFNLYPLAWIAPIGWLLVSARELPVGRRGYFHLWLSGCLFWLVSLHSIRLAFWGLYFGWLAMSAYLAIYIPLMVAVTRAMVHRWNVPLMIAAPVTWTGFELLRSVLLTGYAATTLGHSQAWQPLVIQIADMVGHGGLGFLMMMFAAAFFQLVRSLVGSYRNRTSPTSVAPASKPVSIAVHGLAGVAIPLGVLLYGQFRITQADSDLASKPVLLNCLLLQENTPSVFELNADPDALEERIVAAWTSYADLCRTAAKKHNPIDLVIWPESSFTRLEPYFEVEYQDRRLPGWLTQELKAFGQNQDEFESRLQRPRQEFTAKVNTALLASRGLEPFELLPEGDGPELLVGCEHFRYGKQKFQQFSGSLWISSDGQVKGTYDKMHLVMFGEYIPLKPLLGWLERVIGFPGVDAGTEPRAFKIKGTMVAPNICFETMVPRLICWQVRQLKSSGSDPQLLVNVTNDSWFNGTSVLEHHLACSIICSVENRRPLVVAANTGLTAEIDGCGRLVQYTQPLTAQAIYAQPKADGRWGLVQSFGYPLSWSCAGITLLAAGLSIWSAKGK